jgi:hypothetical protein
VTNIFLCDFYFVFEMCLRKYFYVFLFEFFVCCRLVVDGVRGGRSGGDQLGNQLVFSVDCLVDQMISCQHH